MDWAAGMRVGPYALVERLGAGAMGVVWAATHAETGARVAVKLLSPSAEPGLVERFRREGQAQAAVDGHPNVVRVLGAGEAHGWLYLAMELVPGGDLARRLRQGPLPPAEAARIVSALARGLSHVHRHGVLHRDLKPANVLFGEDGAPRLADFGVARLRGAERLTRTGDLVGTPSYAAPEQVEPSLGRIDERTDVYGLGAILYHCLSGRPPFDGALARVLRQVMTEPPAPLGPEVPPALRDVCLKALAKAPDTRFPSALALAEAIEGALTRPPPRRRARSAALLGAVALLAVAGVAALLARSRADAGAREPLPERPARAAAPPRVQTVDATQDGSAVRLAIVVASGAVRVRIVTETKRARLRADGRVEAIDPERHVHEADAAPSGQTLVAVPLPAGSTTVSLLALDATGREGRPWRAPAPFERPGLEPVGPADDPWREVRNVKDGSILVRVPPTERFVMGTDDLTEGGVRFDPGATPERYRPHAVTLSRGFYLGRVEVTRAQVDRWHLEARGHVRPERPLVIVRDGWRRGEFPLRDDEPAVQVSWHDARAYCEWAGLRLPTEAEWEWAARGPQGFPFPWGTTLPEDAPAGNLSEGTPQLGGHDGYAFLAPVGSYPRGASWCRALDLSGNVSEWVADWFGAFGPEPLVDPVGPPDGRRRVVRGGSWDNTFDMNRAYVRMAFAPEQRDITIGFRVAADAPP